MLFAAVALVQDRRLFKTAPKDIQAAFLYGAWDGLRHDFSLWQFAGRFLAMLYLLKAFDIICFDWFLLTKSHFFQHFIPKRKGVRGIMNLTSIVRSS